MGGCCEEADAAADVLEFARDRATGGACAGCSSYALLFDFDRLVFGGEILRGSTPCKLQDAREVAWESSDFGLTKSSTQQRQALIAESGRSTLPAISKNCSNS